MTSSSPGPGLRRGLAIPASELIERFSRSAGPGGQGVNTTDSRVELLFEPGTSVALTEAQRGRLVEDGISIVASEHRSQLRTRAAARERLTALLREGLAPPPASRRATTPSRWSQQRRIEAKKRRSEVKAARRTVRRDRD